MMPRMMSLAVTPDGRLAVDVDRHRLGTILGKGLGGEDVLDLGGADAEGERPERAVGRGVGVAANDEHPWLGDSLFGSDDVDDAGTRIIEAEEGYAELLAVSNQGVDLNLRHRVGDSQMAVGGWHAVVDGGEGEVGPPNRPAVQSQRVECLGGGDLVNQMEVRVEQVGFALDRANQMLVPDLFEERLRRHRRARLPGGRGYGKYCWWAATTVSPSRVRIIGTSPGMIP